MSVREHNACSRASGTRSVRIELATLQPTIRRAKTSMTKAAKTTPVQVATQVKSATHNWLGRTAVNCRCTRSVGRCGTSSLAQRPPSSCARSCRGSRRVAPKCPSGSSGAPRCNGPPGCAPGSVAATPSWHRRPGSVHPTPAGSRPSTYGHDAHEAPTAQGRLPALYARSTSTGRSATRCRSVRPR